MPERVSDSTRRARTSLALVAAVKRAEKERDDARQERDALREAVREAERRIIESSSPWDAVGPDPALSKKREGFNEGREAALTAIRDATEGVMGDG